MWEPRRKRLFLARDRIGVKPLFYARRGGGLLFASELKTLLAHPLVPPQIDREGLAEIIGIGPGRTPGCGVFRGVDELEPGCCAVYDAAADRLTVRRYWSLIDRECTDSFAQAAEKVRWLVQDSVEHQLVSDVPVCTFFIGRIGFEPVSSIAARH